jgi:V/A-type H+-transporting ATPase subunit B
MRKGAGAGHTRDDHLDVAAQLVSAVARSRDARDLAELIGTGALTATDQRYLNFADAFNAVLMDQRPDENRSLEETLERAWRVIAELPVGELGMLSTTELDQHLKGDGYRGASNSPSRHPLSNPKDHPREDTADA